MARMIAKVTVVCSSLRPWRPLRCLAVAALSLAVAAPASAHDLERTQVWIGFSADGSFVLDVANDLEWLKLRLAPFADGRTDLATLGDVFLDRVVLFVDGHEVRAASAEYLPPRPAADDFPPRATYRLRGRMPSGARTLRWYYGLVLDPYPLTIRRVDGRSQTEWIVGDAWSRAVDLSGQFHAPLRTQLARQGPLIVMLAALAFALRLRLARRGDVSRPTV